MAYFCITYDLNEGKDYKLIIDELTRLGGARVAKSVWLVDQSVTIAVMKDHLADFVDADDILVVIEFSQKPRYTRMLATGAAWIKARFR